MCLILFLAGIILCNMPFLLASVAFLLPVLSLFCLSTGFAPSPSFFSAALHLLQSANLCPWIPQGVTVALEFLPILLLTIAHLATIIGIQHDISI